MRNRLTKLTSAKLKYPLVIALCLLLNGLTLSSAWAAQQCFNDAQQAYHYLIEQQKQQQHAAELAKLTIVNINTAGEAELTSLSGIGSAKAQQIILYRDAFGAFQRIDDLAKVKGIGSKTVANNRSRLVVQ